MSTISPSGGEFPAMVQAAQAAVLVPAERQRRAAVRTAFVEDADHALGVAEGDQVDAEQAALHRRAVGDQLFRHADGQPVLAHDPAHRGVAFDAAEEVVVGRSHGGVTAVVAKNLELEVFNQPGSAVSRRRFGGRRREGHG
ncbi:hypothetical protein LRS10_00020 [Phenylobacterium sp. J426]|nr:hypothetical protein [Phenylobacterium sp. J426]MCR5872716.1 hypothetical protein [Phenylobacterium sp. J426]